MFSVVWASETGPIFGSEPSSGISNTCKSLRNTICRNGDLVGVQRKKLYLRHDHLNARSVKTAAMAVASYTGNVMLLDGDRCVIPDETTNEVTAVAIL